MIRHYIAIARPDHWFKNIFMLPGIIVAYIYAKPEINTDLLVNLFAGIFATCLIASANYVINEWLDAEFDKYHPVKKDRPSLVANLNPAIIYLEYALLAVAGLALSLVISPWFALTEAAFLVMGFMYNVKPFRTKEKAFMDVITESINNPIRFVLGWMIIITVPFPAIEHPNSLLDGWCLSYGHKAVCRIQVYRGPGKSWYVQKILQLL